MKLIFKLFLGIVAIHLIVLYCVVVRDIWIHCTHVHHSISYAVVVIGGINVLIMIPFVGKMAEDFIDKKYSHH